VICFSTRLIFHTEITSVFYWTERRGCSPSWSGRSGKENSLPPPPPPPTWKPNLTSPIVHIEAKSLPSCLRQRKGVFFIYQKVVKEATFIYMYFLFFMAQQPLVGQNLLIIEASRSHSGTTLGRTPLDKWSARHRDLYLQTHNTHTRQTSMPPGGFEPTIPASERPQTHALDRVTTGISTFTCMGRLKNELKCSCGPAAS